MSARARVCVSLSSFSCEAVSSLLFTEFPIHLFILPLSSPLSGKEGGKKEQRMKKTAKINLAKGRTVQF